MIIKNNPFSINPNAPFDGDELNRADNIKVLTQILKNTNQSLVMAIDSPWGTGKTTFIKMWKAWLEHKDQGFSTIYFNAWENDYSDDALASLIGEIEYGFEHFSIKGTERGSARKYLNATKKFGSELLKKVAPTALKVLTVGVLDIEKVFEDEIAKLGKEIAENKIKKHQESKKNIINFKEKLSQFAKKIKENSSSNPLIIFIDELDRCRPTYAIEILEKAKHLFDIEGIIFILGIDKLQLGHSIKSIYGNEFSVEGYLKRFIDTTYNLPVSNTKNYTEYLFHKFNLTEYLEHKSTDSRGSKIVDHLLFIYLSEYFSYFKFSLREQEQAIGHLIISLQTYHKTESIEYRLLAFILLLKFKNKKLYSKFLSKEFIIDDLFSYIDLLPKFELLSPNFKYTLKVDILVLFNSNINFEKMVGNKVNELREKSEDGKTDKFIRHDLKRICELYYEREGFDYHRLKMDTWINKMEIVDSIKYE